MERDTIVEFSLAIYVYFNSHAHVERDKLCRRGKADTGHFNSHAHVERDLAIYV